MEAALERAPYAGIRMPFSFTSGAPDEISHIHRGNRRASTEMPSPPPTSSGPFGGGDPRPDHDLPGEDWLDSGGTDHGRTEEGGHGGESPEETTVFYLASGPSAVVGRPVEPRRPWTCP